MKNQIIFLCGFMGAGKSTIGKKLAEMRSIPFYDLDELIERKEQRSITEIFEMKGESHFRDLEKQYLGLAQLKKPAVLALGGGTICNDTNLRFVKKSGILIFIKPTIDIILQRLKGNPDRPLLRDERGNVRKGENLRSFITNLYNKRLKWYSKAHYIVDVTSEDEADLVAMEIVKLLSNSN
ncbi:MAG TPA: shikimate kinase [Balneolales bacterium]|nr:shikimate kinase [Balneolales bacterium]